MAEKRATIPREIGRTGLRYTQKHIVDDELAPELRWPHSLNTFDKMKSDPLVSGSLMMIKQYIRKVEWDIEPVGGVNANDADKAQADIIRDALFMRMGRSWDQVVADILSFIEYGFSFHEPTYKVYKGNFIWKDFPSRSQKTITGFKFDERGNLDQIKQTPLNLAGFTTKVATEIEIPYSRLLHFRTDSERNNPLGRSILKNAYYAWDKKSKLEYYEAVGIEREMNGLPSFGIPMEYFMADPQEDPDRYAVFQDFIRIGTNVRNNEQACLFLPSDVDENGNKLFSFDLVASRGTRSIDTSKVIERYDYRIAQSMLSDFILMGSSSSGSFALSDNKIGTFIQTLEAYLEIIAEQFNRKAIPELYRLNGWDADKTCKLVHKPIGSDGLGTLADFLEKSSGYITADATLENALRKRADLPERDEARTFLETPVNVHQAQSQRLAMEAAGRRAGSNPDQESEDDQLVDNLMKALDGNYNGEA